MSKKSIIWTIDAIQIQSILDNSNSIVDALKTLGFNPHSGNHRTLLRRIKEDNLSLVQLRINQTKFRKQFNGLRKKISAHKVFVNNSVKPGSYIKRRILKDNLLPYICNKCSNTGLWNNEILSLQLEHINGDSRDHRLENLCFLCPNCHSQTSTFGGKNKKLSQKLCLDCEQPIHRLSKRCVKCNAINKGNLTRKFIISKQELKKLLKKYNMSQIARLYQTSFTTVKKYCIKYNLV